MAARMEHEQRKDGAAGVLMAFLLGTVAGAALALLFAPASGEDTRRAMNRRTRESRERLVEALRQGRGILHDQREHLTTAFDRARQQARGAGQPAQGTPGEPEA